MKKIKLGVLIYTYDRVEDAKGNMDIIRQVWEKEKALSGIKIIHVYNGEKKWYPKKHKEDVLMRLNNTGHFQGAAELIDAGVKQFKEKYPKLDYILVLAADTWLVKPGYLTKIFNKMQEEKLYLTTCAWGLPERNIIFDVGMAVDLFAFDFAWARKYRMFPIDYKEFRDKYGELMLYVKGGNVMLEKLVFARYLQSIFREFNDNNRLRYRALDKMHQLEDREPVHSYVNEVGFWIRKEEWPKMGLYTHHDYGEKLKIIQKLGIKI